MSRLHESHCRTLAGLLGDIVREVLWPQYEARVLARSKGLTLDTRVGSGNATYHRADRRGGHLIVFGWKMVQQKSAGWPTASRWTSGREMSARGYFSGRIDLLSVLAHAACHEFAHLVQTVEGGRTRGSVHNAAFYRVLDEMHRTGVADEVLFALGEQCRVAGVEARWAKRARVSGADAALSGSRESVADGRRGAAEEGTRRTPGPVSAALRAALGTMFGAGLEAGAGSGAGASAGTAAARALAAARMLAAARAASAMPRVSTDHEEPAALLTDIRPGDAVCFVARGRRITGRVRRVNRRTVTVVPDRPRTPGQYWRVAPGSLERI